jgi:hypothetical protein
MIIDHTFIASHGMVDLYVTGRLAEDETARLEEHLLECRLCQDEVEVLRDLKLGLEESANEWVPQPDIVPWWRRMTAIPALAWALAGMAVVMLPGLLLLRSANLQVAHLRTEARQLRAAAETAGKAVAAMGVPVLSLALTRGMGDGPAAPLPRIRLNPAQPALVLVLEYAADPSVTTYRAILESPDGKQLAEANPVMTAASGALGIELRTAGFAPGRYAVRLEGIAASGRSATLGRFGFEVLP